MTTKMKKTQKLWNMKGCSKSKRNLGGKSRKNRKSGGCWWKKNGGSRVCGKCGPSCRCGPKCNCGHNCPGKCYLKGKTRKTRKHGSSNRKQRGGNCNCGLQMGGVQNGGVQNGGCQTCLGGGIPVQSGGGINYGGPPFVGSPWTPSVGGWPGVAGKDGQTNYLSLDTYDKPYLQTQQISERDQQTYMKGGSRHKKAGGIIPQDLVNLGRSMVYGVGSAYNSLNGYNPPANPLPYKDQYASPIAAKSLLF
jgi:hypothetical protein